mmetsp:Transcript_38932/g.95788  ORF Transcript_38932/g.95788 Transcript_38932/m.95788 type:complete len:368 (-) Transcript_38932:1093-2196(-)|eukprot:CAMPEP_0206213082 /NCGR_PEP_ID=MMETSP0047_2-20121206/936_1 /ASSEMBLY_ACC=CAM_ASM_000192 /TAXON_ID=195065 /ORGANISM="Chroomonas mesostigmatica_cf, Strain CCMP1168" /LENGTH=367 /DNA_ID=CAMNT_0053635215 /DNA_START=86 /DNA_END=1189 /DNA_ORIENTATION=+
MEEVTPAAQKPAEATLEKDTHTWNAAFWKFASVSKFGTVTATDLNPEPKATVDAWELKQALDAAGFKLSDGKIVDVLMSLGQDADGRIDFASFLQLCSDHADLANTRQDRESETKSAFEAMGGGQEGEGKVDKVKIKKVLESFELQLNPSDLANAAESQDGVGYNEFAAFLRSGNEDIDLDSNLHSTGVQWLRRDVTDVRNTLKTAQIQQRAGNTVNTQARRTTMFETDEVATSSATDPFSRLRWLEKLQTAINARHKADQNRQKERHRLLNEAAAKGSQKNLETVSSYSSTRESNKTRTPAQKSPATTRSAASTSTPAAGSKVVFREKSDPDFSNSKGTPVRHEKFGGGAHRKEHHAAMAAIKGRK